MTENLEARLRRLEDRVAIEELCYEYGHRLDSNDAAGVVALFTDDCVVDYGPLPAAQASGTTEYARMLEAVVSFFAATSHQISNVCIEFDGEDEAAVRSVLQAWHRYTGNWSDSDFFGEYADRVVRTEDGWRFRRKTLRATGVINFHTEVNPLPRLQPAQPTDEPPAAGS